MSLLAPQLRDAQGESPVPARPPLHRLVPWFIVGFLVIAALRTAGLIPVPLLAPTALVANLLTTISMAALGLGVDIRVVARAGLRVTCAVTISLVVLAVMSYALIRFLGVA